MKIAMFQDRNKMVWLGRPFLTMALYLAYESIGNSPTVMGDFVSINNRGIKKNLISIGLTSFVASTFGEVIKTYIENQNPSSKEIHYGVIPQVFTPTITGWANMQVVSNPSRDEGKAFLLVTGMDLISSSIVLFIDGYMKDLAISKERQTQRSIENAKLPVFNIGDIDNGNQPVFNIGGR